VLILPVVFGAFQPPSPHRAAPLRFFPGAENQETLHRPGDGKDVPVTIKSVGQQIPLSGFGGRKAPNSMGKIGPPRSFDSAPHSAVSRDQSVRRSAQDDGFVGVWTKNILNKLGAYGTQSRGHTMNKNQPRTGSYHLDAPSGSSVAANPRCNSE
jgi:hypothetical protein